MQKDVQLLFARDLRAECYMYKVILLRRDLPGGRTGERGGTMCGQDGRAAIWRARPDCAKWAAVAGGNFLRRGQAAAYEEPTLAAELVLEMVTIKPGGAGDGDMPPGQPEAAA